jgi:L-ascorbate metabolism protein UlaG (beta-lactamase superfamily)
MDIKFYGHACFSITDGQTSVVTDPYSEEEVGLRLPSLTADVIVISHNSPAYNNTTGISGNPRVFNWPGEYETKGVHFKMIHSFHNAKDDQEQLENIVTVIHWNQIRLCHLGAQGTKLTPEQLEQVGDIDILFVPVGDHKLVVDAKKAKEIIEQVEPRIVIPMIYHTEGSKLELDSLESFINVMGASGTEGLDTYQVKRSELPEDNSKVISLNVSK